MNETKKHGVRVNGPQKTKKKQGSGHTCVHRVCCCKLHTPPRPMDAPQRALQRPYAINQPIDDQHRAYYGRLGQSLSTCCFCAWSCFCRRSVSRSSRSNRSWVSSNGIQSGCTVGSRGGGGELSTQDEVGHPEQSSMPLGRDTAPPHRFRRNDARHATCVSSSSRAGCGRLSDGRQLVSVRGAYR